MKRVLLIAAALLILTGTTFAQGPPGGTPAKTGQVTFNLSGTQMTYDKVAGDFRQSYGFNVVMITFSKTGKPADDHLTISLMMQKPGPVDLNQPMGNGIGVWQGGTAYTFEKGKSQCTMTVSKLTGTAVEGTAECPVVNEVAGQGKKSLTSVKFSASAN
jgi:hypothetical protein